MKKRKRKEKGIDCLWFGNAFYLPRPAIIGPRIQPPKEKR